MLRTNGPDESSLYTILVVEDDEGLNRLIRKRLLEFGYSVASATTGMQALSFCKEISRPVLLLDYTLPDMTGETLIRTLEESSGSEACFLIITANANLQVAMDMLRLGALDYILKDGNLLELLPSAVSRAIRKVELRDQLAQSRLELEESEKRFRQLIEQSPDAVLVFHQYRIVYSNPRGAALLGVEEPGRLLGKAVSEFIAPEDHAKLEQQMKLVVETSDDWATIEDKYIRNDRTELYLEIKVLRVQFNGAQSYLAIYRDVTERKLSEMTLLESLRQNRLLSDAMEKVTTGIVISDARAPDHPVIYANPYFYTMTGYDAEEIVGRNCRLLQGPLTDREAVEQVRSAIRSRRPVTVELLNYRKDRTTFWNELQINPVFDEEGQLIHFIGLQKDVSERRAASEQLERVAYHDFLTGLPNRRKFERDLGKHLKETRAAGGKLALLLIDIDRFKLINDSLGHATGDVLLQQFAGRLTKALQDGEKVYRLSGDEFCVVSSAVRGHADLLALSGRMFASIKPAYAISTYEIHLTACIGISLSPDDGDTMESMLKHSDTALYFAKNQGKNKNQIYSSSLDIASFRLFSLSNDLWKALERNQFTIQYMPRVDTRTTVITGMEALVRWVHPDWGHISPTEFIHIAEETGLIVDIGEWVLREACRQNKAWQDQGLPPVGVSVNFSVQQLLKRDILDTIDRILEEIGLSPQYLEIEITESSFIGNEPEVTQLIQNLRKRDIKVSLDDFGTGYSSLYLLQRLSLDAIKIDKSFVDRLLTDSASRSIVDCIMNLARSLGMGVVAEGVETKEQYEYLANSYCNEVQGYYFSRPLNAEPFSQLLARRRIGPAAEAPTKAAPSRNRRKYFRLKPEYPLVAHMWIHRFKGKKVDMGYTEVFVTDIGAGGLRFLLGVNIPVDADMTLKFSTQMLERRYEWYGRIVWSHEVIENEVFAYGVQFDMEEKEQLDLLKALNLLAIRLKHGIPQHTMMFAGDPVQRIQERKQSVHSS